MSSGHEPVPNHVGNCGRMVAPGARRCDVDEEIKPGGLDGVDVLLVEDDPVSREALELILRYYGAEVVSTTSVREALECFEHHSPTIVVSDIGLPLQDGFTLLRSIRAREQTADH